MGYVISYAIGMAFIPAVLSAVACLLQRKGKSYKWLLIVNAVLFVMSSLGVISEESFTGLTTAAKGIGMLLEAAAVAAGFIITLVRKNKKTAAAPAPVFNNAAPAVNNAVPAANNAAPVSNAAPAVNRAAAEDRINDITYIKEIKQSAAGAWSRYDILLDTKIYGWNDAVNWADYVRNSDVLVQSLRVVSGAGEKDLSGKLADFSGRLTDIPELAIESNAIIIAGSSRALGRNPVQIVWYNQSRNLTVFTIANDKELITKYAESFIRRNFGTKDEMKLAMPNPSGNAPK